MPRSAARLRLENVRYAQIDLGGAYAELHLAWRKTGAVPATLELVKLLNEQSHTVLETAAG